MRAFQAKCVSSLTPKNTLCEKHGVWGVARGTPSTESETRPTPGTRAGARNSQ